jgi:hypothetical protein
MRGMMALPTNTKINGYVNNHTNSNITNGPWNGSGYDCRYEGGGVDSIRGSESAAEIRSISAGAKNQRSRRS